MSYTELKGNYWKTDLPATVSSPAIFIGGHCQASVQVFLDNVNAVGTLKLQASNVGPAHEATRFVDVAVLDENQDPTTSITVSSGTDVSKLFDLSDVGYGWLRLTFTFTSGDGTLEMWVVRK